MKKINKVLLIVFLTAFSFTSFANLEVNNQDANKENVDLVVCRIHCSATYTNENGETYTYTASAGGIFTSCETAVDNCKRMLDQLMYPQ